VGEETGSLDEELRRLSAEFRDKALTALEVFADWLPKVVYFSVLMYLAWKIIQLALGYFAMIESFSK
jgi:type II secretory pathway component PulF